jgi:putative restriction endonuclease
MLTDARFAALTCGSVSDTVGLEAAHIKWHQAGGPDTINNGLALCVMHHKLLDLGVFTVSDGRQIQISDRVHGYHGPDEWIFRYQGKSLAVPQSPDDLPHPTFLRWHQREVFKGSPRYQDYPES